MPDLADRSRPAPAMGIPRNLRHLRVCRAVAETRSVTRAAERCGLSQPAVTQVVARFEAAAGLALFHRDPGGFEPTDAGAALQRRLVRATDRLDRALAAVSPRLLVTASAAQLRALIAVREAENASLAARRLGVAQPTVQRAISVLEREAGRSLFRRVARGMIPTGPARALAQAARLAFAELDQADSELADIAGRDAGRIVVGALPLARSFLLPGTIAAFRALGGAQPIACLDGRYDELLAGLRRGEIDFLLGALRGALPVSDVEEHRLFSDSLVLVAGCDHPLATGAPTLADLAACPWVVPRPETPTRAQFEALFRAAGVPGPTRIVDSGSVILMRELLARSDHLGCISRAQVQAEIDAGRLAVLDVAWRPEPRPIGLTFRRNWVPTRSQRQFLDLLRDVARERSAGA